ncbi:uncharacterized protein LOC130628605 [Hydractinia symbiolongicarpus]|uniref:uncharacterized protein LOC130628605 n=1 Tax=Hydractinia symbiolongicarpus TaxID=13093 RepID=UPI002550ECCC|nr:uncharacterized protein LOC130628605 [Hydractinia symbiolongicarpus]XP_057297567.1 uncharacterized protein LOC130628605 [Hydractinia symbiolongicarpus]
MDMSDLQKHPFHHIKADPIPLEKITRKEIYEKISANAITHAREIAHFLLPYNQINTIYENYPNDIQRVLLTVLKTWDVSTATPSWCHLKSVLELFSMERLIHEIEDEILRGCTGSSSVNTPRARTHKDFEGNIILTLTSPIPNITIQRHSEEEIKNLNKNLDFITEQSSETEMRIKIFKMNGILIDKLEITTLEDPKLQIMIPIEETPHVHTNKTIKIVTHGYADILEFIEKIQNVVEPSANIEYISNGGEHRTTVTREKWYRLCWKYLRVYFSLKNAKHIIEAIQFPPYRKGNKISELAYLLKNALMEKEKVGVITNYNTDDHLEFLKKDRMSNLRNYQKRILVIYPNPVIFFNIRYTESESLCDLEDEIMAGEDDIKSLLLLNKGLLRDQKNYFVNIIAAPNMDDGKNSLPCGECHILHKCDVSNVKQLKDYFTKILLRLLQDVKNTDRSNSTFMKVLSNIFGFLATRKTIRSHVPAINANPVKQIQSLMLNTEQLQILYSDEKKKIIFGNFGSGKSLIALYQIKDLVEFADKATVILYICWEINSMFVNDVQTFVQTISTNDLVKIHVYSIIEICAHLNITSVPSLALLITELLRTYEETLIHLIVDEFNGEQLNLTAAKDLRETLTRKELTDSFITILPHSLSKRRTLVYKGNEEPHENYRYDKTDIKIFKLTKCMRTTENIFKLNKAIEDMLCEERTIIYQPKQPNVIKAKTPETDPIKTNPSRNEEKKKTKESSELNTPESLFDETEITVKDSERTSIKPGAGADNKSSIETPIDLDVYAASLSKMPLDKSKKTVTQYDYPETRCIGHNITGIIPRYVTFLNQKQSRIKLEQQLLHDLISQLAIILENSFSSVTTRRLVLCNEYFHYLVLKNVLLLLNVNFIEFTEYSDWQPKDKDGVHVAFPFESQCTLTNYVGCRGKEADQVVMCIDPAARKLKHLALECMTRSHSELIILGIHAGKAATFCERWLPYWLQRWWSGEECFAQIFDNIRKKNLLQFEKWSSVSMDNDTNLTSDCCQINICSKKYREYIHYLKESEVTVVESMSDKGVDLTAFKLLQSTESVKNLKCLYKNERECSLAWRAEGFTYIVRAKEIDNNSDWYEVCRTRQSHRTVKNLKLRCNYKFSVTAVSNLNHSDDKIVKYFHYDKNSLHAVKDLFKIIENENTVKLKKLLSVGPSLHNMRDVDDNTPLIWAARNTDNSLMVKDFIEYGCDVWAMNKYKSNAYHFAAEFNRHTILDTLCRHDVTNINRGDVNNWTPLYYAACCGNISCVDVLLRQNNIVVAVKDRWGRTAYDMAGKEKNAQNRDKIRRMIKDYEMSKKKSED